MATRSKRFNYSRFSKALAFILAILSVASVIVCAFSMTLFLRNYDIKNMPPYKSNFEESRQFLDELSSLVDCSVDMLTKYLSDEMVSSGEAFKLTEAQIWSDYNSAVSAEVELRRNELEQYKLSSEEYGDYSQYLDMNYYTAAPDGTLSVNITHIEQILKSTYNLKVQEEKDSFLLDYEKVKHYLSGVLCLKYAVISRSDGTIVSNIDGADAAADFDSVLRETYPWYMSLTGTSTVNIVNRNSSGNSFYSYNGTDSSAQEYAVLTQKLLGYHNAKKVDFYFAFNESPNSENCVFSGLLRSYIDARTKYMVVISLLFSGLLILVLTVSYLIVVCGKTSVESEVKFLRTDNIPISLHLLLSWLPIYFIFRFCRNHLRNFSDKVGELIHIQWYIIDIVIVAVSSIVIASFALEFILSMARHIKTKTVLSDSLTAKIISVVGGRLDRKRIMDLKKSVLLAIICYSLVCTVLALTAAFVPSRPVTVLAVLLILIVNLSVYLIFLKTFTSFNEIQSLIAHIQQGDFDYRIDESLITTSTKPLADKVVGISNGIKLAVDRATRDEKTKTELITNVSHDLKTPLTAIVNYVELIKREETSPEDKQKYLVTIDEKAKQLKRLIDDLTEVSKLSGGNVEFHPVSIDLYEFALQAVGESSDELEAAKIDMRIKEPDCRPAVFADGQKTWRIMENLISNVVKYAMPETRAYVEVSGDNKFGYVTVKNVSAAPLELSGDELCARFTRGDFARTSEGFGLGLSIAKSLCELQNGSFGISVDGDLFKATVALPLAPEDDK